MSVLRIGVLATIALGLAPQAGAATPTAPATPPVSAAAAAGHPSEVNIADTRRIDFVSKVNGRGYSIDIALPDAPPPPKGYPVIYVIDGYAYFDSMAEAARDNGNAPQAIIVGIGYPHDAAWAAASLARHQPLPGPFAAAPPRLAAMSLERTYDLTLPLSAAQISAAGAPLKPADVGGVDDFLKTIETEVKPRVYALAPVDRADQSLFGHSLGGLAVVEALFTEPDAFHTFVAASPSIWWGDNEVLQKEAALTKRIAAGETAPRVLVTVGADEELAPKLPPELAAQKAKIEVEIKKDRMVGNACDLATRLQALHGAPGYQVANCAVFTDQGHGISVWPAIGRAVSFIVQP